MKRSFKQSWFRVVILVVALQGAALPSRAQTTEEVAPDAESAASTRNNEIDAKIDASANRVDINLAPREMQLASQKPSGNAVEDTIYLKWYPAKNAARLPAPAVILLHPLGRQDQSPMHEYARYLSKRGIAAAVMTLPYHGRRLPSGDDSTKRFFGPDVSMTVQAAQQSAADIRSVIDWMIEQPNVDANRIGGIGLSLGAILLHTAMGQDARIRAGVAALGGGDLARIQRGDSLSREDLARLAEVDPMAFAANNQPRRVLMIQAARDNVVPPQSAETLWNALGKPPIRWLDTNHFSPINFASRSILRASVVYLNAVWDGAEATTKIPRVHAPMFKLGVLSGLDSRVTPAIQWQFLGAGSYRHRKLFTANAGLSGRGPFLGVAATVTSYMDVGVARRLRGDRVTPYVSFHIVY